MVSDGEVESRPKRARHHPDDHYGRVGGALSLYSPGLGAHSRRHLRGSQACWTLSGFVGDRFPAANGPPILVIRSSVSCFVSISWRQRRNWSSMGGFTRLLDMAVSSNGPVGCLRMAKASEIGRSPGSGCTQALAYLL